MGAEKSQLVWGLHAVNAVLARAPEDVLECWVRDETGNAELAALVADAARRGLRVQRVPAATLDRLRGRTDTAGRRRPVNGLTATTVEVVTADALTMDAAQLQQEVLRLVARGLTDRDISETLHISMTTVRSHLRAVYARLKVKSRLDLSRALTGELDADGGRAHTSSHGYTTLVVTEEGTG